MMRFGLIITTLLMLCLPAHAEESPADEFAFGADDFNICDIELGVLPPMECLRAEILKRVYNCNDDTVDKTLQCPVEGQGLMGTETWVPADAELIMMVQETAAPAGIANPVNVDARGEPVRPEAPLVECGPMHKFSVSPYAKGFEEKCTIVGERYYFKFTLVLGYDV